MNDLGHDAKSLLDAARDTDDPTSADDMRMRRALAAKLGVGIGLTATSTAAAAGTTVASAGAGGGAALATGTTFGLVAKTLTAVALVGGISAGGYVHHAHSSRPASVAMQGEARTQAQAVNPTPIATPIATPTPTPTPTPMLAASPTRSPSATAVPSPRAGSSSPAPSSSSLDEETRLLREADQAIRAHDGVMAMALLEEHARRFPRGLLAEERNAERVLALCELGRTGEARRAAAAFLARSPRSPLADRVRASCIEP